MVHVRAEEGSCCLRGLTDPPAPNDMADVGIVPNWRPPFPHWRSRSCCASAGTYGMGSVEEARALRRWPLRAAASIVTSSRRAGCWLFDPRHELVLVQTVVLVDVEVAHLVVLRRLRGHGVEERASKNCSCTYFV